MNFAIWQSGAMSGRLSFKGDGSNFVQSTPTVEILATFEKWSMVRYWPVEVRPEPSIGGPFNHTQFRDFAAPFIVETATLKGIES